MPISTTTKSDRRKRELRETTACLPPTSSDDIGLSGGSTVDEPFAVRPSKAWRLLDCGNTHGYELLAAGELESYRDGRSRRITMRSIKAYIARRLAADRATSAAPTDAQSRRRGRPGGRADTAGAP
jgi:excisionase family DNA binding protein